MASLELAAKETRRGKRRIGFRLDMTPLVDVAFLLLTFFMFATTMSQPHAMEIRVPADVTDVGVPRMLSVLVRADGQLFMRHGLDDAIPVDVGALERVTRESIMTTGNSLVVALKADESAAYGSVVTVLDRLNAVEADVQREYRERGLIRERRFTIAPMDEDSRRRIESL